MAAQRAVRALALVGPTGAGKTTLMSAMIAAAGGHGQEKLGDLTPEAKARGHSVELNIAGFEFLGDRYVVIDCPGSLELASEADAALAAVDMAVVVTDPDPLRAGLVQPMVRQLEALGVPHAIFVNRMDQARGPVSDLLAALTPVSAAPLVARQLPIIEGEKVTGFVDLALERAHVWRPGKRSEVVELTPDLAKVEADARFHMLEQLADFDDELMEQLLSDVDPARETVFADLARDFAEGLIAPVFFGSALASFGIVRLLKALRHEAPPPERAAARLGVSRPGAYVLKVSHAGQAGKLAYARVFGAALSDSAELTQPSGARARSGGLFQIHGAPGKKIAEAAVGEIVAIAKLEDAQAGQTLAVGGAPIARSGAAPRAPLFALGVAAANRKDDVRFSGALAKLVEEDPGLSVLNDPETHQVLVRGQGDGHVRLAIERLKRRWGVDVAVEVPRTPYRETISAGVTQRGRHKKQTGGHGQFADVTVEVKPLSRGAGFAFVNRTTGGSVPRQWIPAVEQGVRDAMTKGPLGFPVADIEVTLTDGQSHPVDSSEMAFRTAGRIAIDEALAKCGPRLLEPIDRLAIYIPTTAMSAVNSALSARRGQILGFVPRDGWPGWERIDANLPASERHDLIAEVRSLSQGLGSYEAQFDHMAELTGRIAQEISKAALAEA